MRFKKTTVLLMIFILLFVSSAFLLIDQTIKNKGLFTPTSKAISRFSRYWSEVTPNSIFKANVTNYKIDVARIEFSVANKSREFDLSIRVLRDFTHKTNVTPPSIIRQYFEIIPADIPLSSALIGFMVPKSWLLNNSIPEKEVKLYRYFDGVWNQMATLFIASNNNFAYYYAASSNFGFFVISGTPKEPGTQEVITPPVDMFPEKVAEELFAEESQNEKTTEGAPTEEKPSAVMPSPEKKSNLFMKVIITIILLLIIGTIVNMRVIKLREKKPQQTQVVEQESPELKQRLNEAKIYIITALSRGFSDSVIKQELLKLGWKEEIVNSVFTSAKSHLTSLDWFIKKSLAGGMSGELIRKKLLDQGGDIKIVDAALQNQNN